MATELRRRTLELILSKTAQYALRIAAFLAQNSDSGRPFRSVDLADSVNVPRHYASKILKRLVDSGLLTAEKGHGGGFTLSKNSLNYSFSDILAAVEGKNESKQCVFGLKTCSDRTPCPLHFRWKSLTDVFNGWANSTLLSDIAEDVAERKK